jgi:two-component SAPR family response regulator
LQDGSIARIFQLLDRPIDVNRRVSAAFVLLLAHTQAHHNGLALRLVERITPCMEEPDLTALNRAYWWLLVGYLHQRRGARAETEEALNRSDRIAAEQGLRQPEFLSRCFRVQHCCTWSDLHGALRALDGLETFVSDENAMTTAQYHKQRMFLEILRGNPAAAELHARNGATAALSLGSPFFKVVWLAQGAAALAMNGAHDDAAAWLSAAWIESDNGFIKTYQPMILASEFFARVCRGATEQATDFLCKLFAITPDADAFSYVGTMPVVRDAVLVHALTAGIRHEFVRALIRKYDVVPTTQDVPSWPWPVKVYALGAFHVEVNGERVRYSRKTPKKVLLLLKALIAMGGTALSSRRVAEALWPDEEGDAALEALGASLHRLRKLLAHPNAIVTEEGLLTINRSVVWVDLWCFERRVSREGDGARVEENDHKSVLALYRGHFLDDEDVEAAWAIAPRERARGCHLRYLVARGRALEDAGDFAAASDLYRAGIETDELAEDLYQGLMRSLIVLGQTSEAVRVFSRLRSVLGHVLGIGPSSGSARLIEALRP